MPDISGRAKRMPPSPIRKLVPFADAAVARGTKIYHLNIGQPDIESPVEFWDGIRAACGGTLEYSHAAGIAPLREGIAAKYREIGIDVSASQVLTCTAGSEALAFAMMVACNPGDEVIVPEPLYANYNSFATVADVQLVPITTRIEADFALPSVEEFEKRVTPRTKAILINNPGNPTGTVYTDEQLNGLRDLAVKHDLYVISDEVYREFNFTGRPIRSVLELEGLSDRAVMVDSVSKRYSLCGARIGFLVSRNEEFNAAALRFAMGRLSPPTLESRGVLAALATPKAYFDSVREEFMARRDLLMSRLNAMDGVRCPKIEGAFYAMVQLPIDDSDRFCQWLLESFSSNGRTVMLAPGTGFYSTPGLGRDQVRIAYVLNKERINEAMDCLEQALAVYPGRLAQVG